MDAAKFFSTNPSSVPAPKTRLGRFFYDEQVPYGLALVRMTLLLVLLFLVVQRWPHARELFSSDGAAAPIAENYGFFNYPPELPGTVVVALFSALGFFLFTGAIGWCTRISLIASTILYTYFNLVDCLSTITKYSVIASHVLLLLSISPCGAVWSVDSWLNRRRHNRSNWPGEIDGGRVTYPVWSRRLLQILVGTVYFGAAVTKMHTPEFFSGDQLRYWMMTNINFPNPLGEYLTVYPASLVVFSYIAIVWEVLFLFLAWKGWGRISMLSLGALFHLMTTFTLGLYIFPLVSCSIYFAFLEERDIQTAARLMRRWRRKLGLSPNWYAPSGAWLQRLSIPSTHSLPSGVVFTFLVVTVTFVGVETEYWSDPYQKRSADGPLTLKELDADLVAPMLTEHSVLRPQDKFYSFHTGTVFIGGILVNRRSEVRPGEPIFAQCSLNPPHEDMWVECNLHDVEDRLINRTGQIVSREMLRADFVYKLTESLEPGDYYLVLNAAGQEITRRKITLLPKLSAAAN